MKVGMEVSLTMVLYHKETMRELKIDKVYKREFDENSQDYKDTCDMYSGLIGFDRNQNKDEYDKLVLKFVAKDVQEAMLKANESIANVFKKCFKDGYRGYVEFCGYIINPNDFCAVRMDDFKANYYKK